MRRVLILGLYYPPANFMAGRRLEGWARHLPSFGYQPLVLTRYYEPEEGDSHDFYASSRSTQTLTKPWIEAEGVVHTRFRQSAWNSAPVPGMVRGLAYYAWPDPDHSGWYRECRKFLSQSQFRPDLIIGSQSPPGVLSVARRLAGWLKVPWVADFRDLWVTEEMTGLDKRLKTILQRRHLRTAAGVTVATEGMATALRNQLKPLAIAVKPIYNGAEPVLNAAPDPKDEVALQAFQEIAGGHDLVLTYTGTLYEGQRVELLLEALAEFGNRTGKSCAVVLCGIHDRPRYERWPFVHILGPVSHSTSLYLQRESTAVFYPTWPATNSIYSGKLFEMALSGRPVIVAFTPSPDLEALCERMKSVIVTRDSETLIKVLGDLPHHRLELDDQSTIATKSYWAGELAGFFDDILAVNDQDIQSHGRQVEI